MDLLYKIMLVVLCGVLLLGPLIAIHEFGHFWVARRFGVKVLKFAIGFGPVLLSRTAADGVQYQLRAIPLGGFVQMADEREGEVAEQDLPHAFNRQSPWVKMAVVAAGPFINLALAFVIYWGLFVLPQEHSAPKIGHVALYSPAFAANVQVGDRIVAVDGMAVNNTRQLNRRLINRLGDTGMLRLQLMRGQQSLSANIALNSYLDKSTKNPLANLGLSLYVPPMGGAVGAIQANSAAALQGLKVGDVITHINGVAITHWLDIAPLLAGHAEKNIKVQLQRQNAAGGKAATITLTIMPQLQVDHMGNRSAVLGVSPVMPTKVEVPAAYKQLVQYNLAGAAKEAGIELYSMSKMTLKSFYKLITLQLSAKNISGPITIAKVAHETAYYGFIAFMGLMAIMSVTLGVMNLLPIPVLDGGHLLAYFVEALRGKPMSDAAQAVGMRLGLVLLGGLMAIALFNDVAGLF